MIGMVFILEQLAGAHDYWPAMFLALYRKSSRKDAFAPCTKCIFHLPDTEIRWSKKRFQLNKN
jgi:hypothetical protein|tara:strand:- start:1061 stop:1249 length:189 start_codon:yes stop_codon:yes gene_type:complete